MLVDLWKFVLAWAGSRPEPQTEFERALLALVEEGRKKHLTLRPVSVEGC